jgi:hypothetical protein
MPAVEGERVRTAYLLRDGYSCPFVQDRTVFRPFSAPYSLLCPNEGAASDDVGHGEPAMNKPNEGLAATRRFWLM